MKMEISIYSNFLGRVFQISNGWINSRSAAAVKDGESLSNA